MIPAAYHDAALRAAFGGHARVLAGRDVSGLESRALDPRGRLRVVPDAVYGAAAPEDLSVFGVRHGVYLLPTDELVAWLRGRIAGRRAIEIGSGNGVLAEALGIPATDNRMQERPEVAAYYKALGQPLTVYGPNVARLDAAEAVARHRPEVVVTAWVTHRFDPRAPERGGNAFGVDMVALVRRVPTWILVGNECVHGKNPALGTPHETVRPPGLRSRAFEPARDRVWIWERT